MDDVVIVGGGVVGLSLAYELASRGLRVRALDRQEFAQEASWAGAGILPPAPEQGLDCRALRELHTLSLQLHAQWSGQLLAETGLENGYRCCGGLYLAGPSSAGDPEHASERALDRLAADWQAFGISIDQVTAGILQDIEPAINAGCFSRAYLAPGEAQIRNPRHLRALLSACHKRNVVLEPGTPVTSLAPCTGTRALGVLTPQGLRKAGTIVVCAGAWTGLLGEIFAGGDPPEKNLAGQDAAGQGSAGQDSAVRPIRGQIALLRTDRLVLRRVVNLGPRYLVPRNDGRLLVGSTEEEVGFEKRTTAGAIRELLSFAERLVPELANAQLERCWSGLRPATPDRLPVIGRTSRWSNVYIATGHFRAGLTLSPGTARVVGQLICEEQPAVDLTELTPKRFSGLMRSC